jgi:hypothetical protein
MSARHSGTNIVVEAAVFIAPFIEQVESKFGVEIFELDEHLWPASLDCFHELCNEFLCLCV